MKRIGLFTDETSLQFVFVLTIKVLYINPVLCRSSTYMVTLVAWEFLYSWCCTYSVHWLFFKLSEVFIIGPKFKNIEIVEMVNTGGFLFLYNRKEKEDDESTGNYRINWYSVMSSMLIVFDMFSKVWNILIGSISSNRFWKQFWQKSGWFIFRSAISNKNVQ